MARARPPVLRFRRRTFLGSIWAGLALGKGQRASAQPAVGGPLSPRLAATLEAAVDTVVPRDTDPGSLDAGVPARILAHLAARPDALTLYRDGLELLDRLARQTGASSFPALDGPARERILSSLARGSDGARGRGEEFVARIRRDVLAFYWGSVTGQAVLGYRPPLSGYPEYADPPPPARRRTP